VVRVGRGDDAGAVRRGEGEHALESRGNRRRRSARAFPARGARVGPSSAGTRKSGRRAPRRAVLVKSRDLDESCSLRSTQVCTV